jgi:hypothetical protein
LLNKYIYYSLYIIVIQLIDIDHLFYELLYYFMKHFFKLIFII